MTCKKTLSNGFSSYTDLIFPETYLANYIKKSCSLSYKTRVSIAIVVGFVLGLLKIVTIPAASALGIVLVPLKTLHSFMKSQRFSHLGITWLLCVLTTALAVIGIACLLLFGTPSLIPVILSIAVSLGVLSTYILFVDRAVFEKVIPGSSKKQAPNIIYQSIL